MYVAALCTINSQEVEGTPASPTADWAKCAIYTQCNIIQLEILTYATTQMHLGDTILSKTSQSQADKHCIIPLIWLTEKSQIIETESRMVVTRGWGWGRNGKYWLSFNGYRVLAKWKGLWKLVAQQCEYTYSTDLHLKSVNGTFHVYFITIIF